MSKQEFLEVFNLVLDGRSGYSVEFRGNSHVHVYSLGGFFTAAFIRRINNYYDDFFMGVEVDSENRIYLLFSI